MNQAVSRFVGGLAVKERFFDLVVARHARQAVGAEQKAVAGLQVRRQKIGGVVPLRAERARDDVAPGVRSGFLRGQNARANQLADEGMILRELLHAPAPQAIDAAVADMRDIDVACAAAQHRERRAHARAFGVPLRALVNPLVRAEHRLFDLVDGRLLVPRGHFAHRVNRHPAGHFARQMAAHAVRDDKNAAFFVKPGRILILFAFFADIGAHRRRHAVHSRRFQVSLFRLLSLI